MQNNNIHTDQPDAFSEKIRQKLENHELPVDAACWGEIEARLKPAARKKVIPFWWWLSGGAAVAILALLLTLRPAPDKGFVTKSDYTTSNTNSQKKSIVSNVQKEKPTVAANVAPAKNTANVFNANTNLAALKSTNATKKTAIETTIADKLITSQTLSTDSTQGNTPDIEIPDNNVTNDQIAKTTKSAATVDSVPAITRKRIIPNSLIAETDNEPVAKTKHKNEWLLAAAFGSGGSTSMNGVNEFVTADVGNKYFVAAQPNYTSIMAPNDFSQKNFMSPLSFGLTVRKNLSKTIGIESGLVYTYLLSTFEDHNFVTYDASLKLHYLGIPLNLVVQVWKFSNLEIYVSGGGMVEKGLRSVYVQKQYMGNQTITTTANTKIDGLQWSLNGAVGTTYKLQRNIGIYFEPKFSYFFDNDQPISARTDRPVVIGLTAGLRFQF